MRLFVRGRDFVRLGRRDQVRLVAIWSLLGLSRLAILVLPFRVIRRLLGEDRAVAPAEVPVPPLDERSRARAYTVGNLILIASRNTPWRSECYPQALTARAMLGVRRIPHRTSFGLRREDGELKAHVWVQAGDVAVSGGDGSEYTAVASFVWSPA